LIEIDGSYGEGGGSVLRIATALSAVTSKPVHITNIRSGRPKPGLMPQHMNAVKAVADLSNASVKGLEVGSTEISFTPKSLNGGVYEIDIGTAGSISLILQAFMIPAAFADGPVKIRITGGTDVRWAPSVDYVENVTLPILRLMGYNAHINIIRRGHYPRGGGILEIEVEPIMKLKPLNISDLQFDCICGISHSVKLPIHIAERQAQSAENILQSEGYKSKIIIKGSQNATGPGFSIFLWTNGITPVSGSAIGEPGKKAEKVGSEAAKQILYHISRRSAVDRYMGDQLIPYMALAGSSSIKTAELTQHALTNIHITEKFIDKKFQVDGIIGEAAVIMVD
jgi:RNA 3'-terminal phosphate cyclase (ATP)